MVSAGMNIIRYLLFAFNLLFCIFGITLMGIGIYVQIQLKSYLDFFSTDVNGPAILLIIVGLATLAIAFFGCCGAIKENHCMTLTFAALIGLVFICEFSAGIAGYALKAKVQEFVTKELTASMHNYDVTGHEGVQKAWNYLQETQHCCGASGPNDWESYSKVHSGLLPQSCCKTQLNCSLVAPPPTSSITSTTNSTANSPTTATDSTTTDAPATATTTTTPTTATDAPTTTPTLLVRRDVAVAIDGNYYNTSCIVKVENFMRTNIAYFAGAAVGLAVVELLGIILAAVLFRAFRSEHEVV